MKRDVSIIESQIKIAAINAGRPVRNASSPFQNGICPAWIHDLKADTAGHQAHKSPDREAAMSPSRRGSWQSFHRVHRKGQILAFLVLLGSGFHFLQPFDFKLITNRFKSPRYQTTKGMRNMENCLAKPLCQPCEYLLILVLVDTSTRHVY